MNLKTSIFVLILLVIIFVKCATEVGACFVLPCLGAFIAISFVILLVLGMVALTKLIERI